MPLLSLHTVFQYGPWGLVSVAYRVNAIFSWPESKRTTQAVLMIQAVYI